jgi:putative membrane protein
MSQAGRDDPFVISASELPPPGPETAATAPPPPDEEGPPEGAAVRRAVRLAARPPSRIGSWALRLALGLLALVVSVAAYDFVAGLIARSPLLGWLAFGLAAALAATLVVMLVREFLAIRLLKRIDSFHDEARAALTAPDAGSAQALVAKLDRFYAGRPDLRWERERLEEGARDVLDADALVELAERTLMAPLDAAARREVEGAARTVAAATALVPLALIDVLAALSMNVRMIRRIAQIYGGRAGVVGSIRLLRMVATHLLATGAVAVGDDFVHSVAGGGLAARLSRRFGEGVINGALTARIGIAAMEVCRPLPFRALPRPRVANIMSRSVTSLMQKAD